MAYLVGIIIAFLQGYYYVPEYRFFYVVLCWGANQINPEANAGKTKSRPLSMIDLGCESGALLLASFLLLVPYKLFFLIVITSEDLKLIWLGAFVVGFVIFRIRQELQLSRKLEHRSIYADFSKLDAAGSLILSSFWTLRDLERRLIELREGRKLNFYGQDPQDSSMSQILSAEGILHFDDSEKQWVAKIDWATIKRSSAMEK